MPPKVWIALWVTEFAASEARAFAMCAASGSDSGLRVGAPRRVVGQRARLLDVPEHVGEPVRDRLIGADRAPELLALLCVLDRHVERPLGDADELGRERDRRALTAAGDVAVERVAPVGADPVVGPRRVDQVHALELGLRGLDDASPRPRRQHEHGRALGRADDRRVLGGQRQPPRGLAGGNPGKPAGLLLVAARRSRSPAPAPALETNGVGASA